MAGFALAASITLSGCERSQPAPPTVSSPVATTAPAATSEPAATVPSTVPVATLPSVSTININGHTTIFPAARVRLEEENGHIVALLFSDDPREALRDNYTGNSFYLKMELDITDADQLAQAEWHYQMPSVAQREDSPYGIYLSGRQVQLQPFDVRARFKPDAKGATVLLSGQFEMSSGDKALAGDHGPAQVVPVAAQLTAQVEKKIPGTK